jgi:tetratricopeptide (TPR) repeat protein
VTPERWKRVRAAIDSALEASSPAEREAALVKACAGDPTLLSEARSIMQAAGTGDDLPGFPASRTSEDEGAETRWRGSFVDEETGDQAERPTHDWRSAAPSHPRFEILSRLGEGGMGVVYLALDRDHQARVALKTISKMTAMSLLRFKNEFRALTDVVHPNLVRLFELLGEQDTWFFTMEYVEGLPFFDHVCPPAEGQTTLDIPRLRAAFPQLVEAVATIHAAGKLHCDIKSSNVMVAENGRVVVLDFGLMTEIDAPRSASRSRSIAGTLAFMSPEQARGETLNEASDWYSVGVMLYQALAGRLPFDDRDLGDLLRRKQGVDPASPLELDPTLPADLSQLSMELLRRDPGERPAGSAILRRLERPSSHAREDRSWFVGRGSQLALLHGAVREVRAGNPQTIYVHGPSGVGKTALVQRFLEGVGGEALVLRGRCYERESVPYKALDSVMDDLAHRLGGVPEVAPFLVDDVAHLARIFPVLTQLDSVQDIATHATDIADLQEVRRRAFAALRELFHRLSGSYLLIVFVDDLQWGDLDSAGLLSALLAPPHPPRLLFVGSYRSEHAETSPVLKTLLQNGRARKVEVGLLSDDDAGALARSMLGPKANAATVEAVVREAGGTPLFVAQLVHAVDQLGVGEPRAPLSLDGVLKRRLSHLDASSRRLLEHVAVGGQPLPQAAILRAAAVAPELGLADLATLRSGHWVRTEGMGKEGSVEPFHDRIRESIVASLTPDALSRHHLALALALEPMAVDPETLAVHFSGAGRFVEGTRYATQAADRAAESLAFNRAARLYRLALGWQPSDSKHSQVLRVGLATALAHAGRSAEAGDAYLSATEGSTAADALLYKQRAAEQYLNHGHVEKGYTVLADLLRAVGLRMPKEGAYAVMSLLTQRLRLWWRGLRYRRAQGADGEASQHRIDVCLLVGKGLSMIDPIRGAEFQTRALRLALETGDLRRVSIALAVEAGLEGTAGQPARPRVDRLLDESEKLGVELDDIRISAFARFMRGVTHYLRGEWQVAMTHCVQAESLFRERCVNAWWEIDQSTSFALWSLCYLGRLGEAATRVPPLLAEARDRGDLILVSQLLTGHTVLVRLAQDEEPQRVREDLLAGLQPWHGLRYNMPHFMLMSSHCFLDLYLGRGADGLARIERDLSRIRSSLLLQVQFLKIEFLGLRARCTLAAATTASDPRPLLAKAQRDARALERIGTAWARAHATQVRAQVAIARGDLESACTLLTRAGEAFERLDMHLHAVIAAYRLGGLIGGADGATRTAASISEMRMLGVKNPEPMARAFVPLLHRLSGS